MTIIEHDAGSELNIPKEGKYAIMFHLPGHCAGCKVALKTLEDKELKDITVELIDAGDESNRPLINEYKAQTAPTIVYFENGEEYEPKIVGEYSIKYRITKDLEMLNNVLNKNCTFTFVFNSDDENPKFLFYINDTCINDRVLTSGKAGATSFNPEGLDIGDEVYDGELLVRCIPYNSAYKPRKTIVYNVGDKFNLKGHSFEVISIIESVVVISNDNYSKPPSFEDYKDHVRYDVISTLDPDVDVIRLTAKLPTHEIGIQDIVVYDEDDVEIDTYDLEELKLLGIFDDLIRDNVHISNYNATSGNFTRDEVQTADSVADADFLRQYKIIGDITWRNYKLRYDYYQSMQKNCTLKNYSMYLETKETKDGVPFVNEVYYTLDTVTPTTVMTFSKELTLEQYWIM